MSQHTIIVPSRVGKTGTETILGMAKSTTDQIAKPEEPANEGGKAGEQQAAGNQGDAKQKQRNTVFKGKRKGKPGKIHIRLPPIEAYQKDLCFAAEAPGRVVVRLERLMGSDKIRPVDGKFMETLIQRLEEEEKIAWDRKIRLRKKAEKERYRQLAISGLMEPGPGMEDLYNHPVFRVNRILNRLSSLDNTFSHNPALKLPPIVQINPFETDETGAFFKEYPAHRALRKECEKYKDKTRAEETPTADDGIEELKSYPVFADKTAAESKIELASQLQSVASVSKASSKTTISAPSKAASKPSVAAAAASPPSDIEEEDEYDEELEENLQPPPGDSTISLEEEEELTEMDYLTNELHREYIQSLTALQSKYGVPKSSEFEDEWKPFRAPMVDNFITDFETVDDMYEGARHLFDVYTRQAIVTQEHIRGTAKSGPSKAKRVNKSKKQLKATPSSAASEAPSASATEEPVTDVDGEAQENEEMLSENMPIEETVGNALVNDEEIERRVVENGEEMEPIPNLTDEEEVEMDEG